MSLYALKPRLQSLLRPVVQALYAAGVTANQVTIFACAVSVLLGAWLAWNAAQPAWFLLLPAWFALRMACNAIDGMLARDFAQSTPLGAYLNELTDVVSDAALYLPFAFVAGIDPLWVAAVVATAVLVEFAGVLGLLVGASRRYDGPLGKSDRALVLGALALAFGLGAEPAMWVNGLLATTAALSLATIVNRVRHGVAEAAGRTRP